MTPIRTERDLHALRDSVERVGRLSDSVVRAGPFSIGLDGVLSWIPGVGEVYSAAAGGFILVQGVRAGVPAPTLAMAGALMLGRTAISAVPLAGPAAADLFTAHKWSARLVARAIDRKLAAQGPSAAVRPARRKGRRLGPAIAAA